MLALDKKTVNSYNPEFGYELIAVLPYAYWLHSQGLLEGTIGAVDTGCLYYFSPKHKISKEPRSWYNGLTTAIIKLTAEGVPNAFIHKPNLDTSRFLPPPYKKAYKNDWAKFAKPSFVIYNRYNREWPADPQYNRPVNYFSEEFLEIVFDQLREKYQVIYFNVEGTPELYDNAPPIHFDDYDLCHQHGVVHVHDLKKRHPGLSYNQIQMYYFANCQRFLTMNGGGGILASYFGGVNIIYSKHSKELQSGDFGYYHLFGGSEIKVARTYNEILTHL
jgi:hypothetical protein